jgi:hypothetical protein
MRASRILITSIFGLVIALGLFWGIARANSAPADLNSTNAKIIYVDIDNTPGAGPPLDGTSWQLAFQHLQTALFYANPGDQIWVAEGVYYPDWYADNDRTTTFSLKEGVAIYDGFDPGSGADTFEERDWQTNVTVLSGDIDGNDTVDPNSVVITTTHITGDNAYHVVSSDGVTETTSLDGFVITAGKADGVYVYPCGPHAVEECTTPIATRN